MIRLATVTGCTCSNKKLRCIPVGTNTPYPNTLVNSWPWNKIPTPGLLTDFYQRFQLYHTVFIIGWRYDFIHSTFRTKVLFISKHRQKVLKVRWIPWQLKRLSVASLWEKKLWSFQVFGWNENVFSFLTLSMLPLWNLAGHIVSWGVPIYYFPSTSRIFSPWGRVLPGTAFRDETTSDDTWGVSSTETGSILSGPLK